MKNKDNKSKYQLRKVSALSMAFLEHQSFLKKYLWRYLDNHQDIDDIAQETYLRAYQAEQKQEIIQPKAFLFRIAKNLALTKLTRKSQQITDYLAGLDDSIVISVEAELESDLIAQQQLGIYCDAIAALPGQCRRVYLLRKVHGLTHREIAEQMNLSISSVEKHLRNGILKCKAYVDGWENVPIEPAVIKPVNRYTKKVKSE